MYDPALMRFTDRDPVTGGFEVPLTLHPYLYCANDSVNRIDLTGKDPSLSLGGLTTAMGVNATLGSIVGIGISVFSGNTDPYSIIQAAFAGALGGAIGGGAAYVVGGLNSAAQVVGACILAWHGAVLAGGIDLTVKGYTGKNTFDLLWDFVGAVGMGVYDPWVNREGSNSVTRMNDSISLHNAQTDAAIEAAWSEW